MSSIYRKEKQEQMETICKYKRNIFMLPVGLPRYPGNGHNVAHTGINKILIFSLFRNCLSEPESLGPIVGNQGTKHANIKNKNAFWTRWGMMYLQIGEVRTHKATLMGTIAAFPLQM